MSELKLRWHDWQQVDARLKREFAKVSPRPNDDNRRALAMNIWGVLCPLLKLEYEKRVRPIQELARQMQDAVDELDNFAGPYWPTPAENIPLEELQATLNALKFYVWDGGCICPTRDKPTKRGRKQKSWHEPAYQIATLVKNSLKSAGHARRISINTDGSLTNEIALAIMVSGCVGLRIESSDGFKKGMRQAQGKRRRGNASKKAIEQEYRPVRA
jgi:hypothetical protein